MATAGRAFSKGRTIKQNGNPARAGLPFCFGGTVEGASVFPPDGLFGRLERQVFRRHATAPQKRAEHRADGLD